MNDRDALIRTPYADLLTWKMTPEVIASLKSSKKPFISAFDYFKQKEKFQQVKFNVESLDSLTEGGIDVGSVTEIFGEAGSGKSQLCMQLALNCALPKKYNGLEGRSVYVSTDKRFSIQRLNQMANCMKEMFNLQDLELLDNIDIIEFTTTHELLNFVKFKLPQRIELYPNVRLVIIDSIAGIFRHETNYIKRATDMRETVRNLERLADEHNLAIIMSNHVTGKPGAGDTVSTLGLAFENLVVTKLKVKKTEMFQETKGSRISRVRLLDVIFSPRLPRKSAKFLICSSGIVQASQNY